jgi:phosphoribosyl 1,2-cyclic phosphate phosphodiesterase
MKIEFLGTSAGWPLPRLGCKCEICTSSDSKDKRGRTQLLVNEKILLDAGPDTYSHLICGKPQTISHLLISHAHPDHIMGIWDLSHIYNQPEKIQLIVTQEVLNGLRQIPNFLLVQFKIKVIKPFETFEIDKNTKASYFPVEHSRLPAYGIKIKSGKILAYIPDFAQIPKRSKNEIKDAHILVIDGSSLATKARSHQSIAQGLDLARELKAGQVYFVHLGHKTGIHQELEKFVQENGGRNFHIAYDTFTIVL